MLRIIGEIVRQVALIGILAGLLEMLLPQRAMGRYVRLVLGLFVLVAILSPLAEILRRGEVLDVVAWDLRPDNLRESSFDQIQTWTAAGEETALKIFRQRVAGQMRSLISLMPGVKTVEVEVEAEREKTQGARISGVVVTVELDKGDKTPSDEPQPSGTGPTARTGEAGKAEDLTVRIKQTLAFFYGLEPEVIVVQGR